ncbi:perforin-1-like isoform X2 [Pelodiscus sinensis]|uniref:perforin-1-like isoform X2 n=1 Tax=Pelodiscus sinensis TaxID=13735 RepID=UPI003F6B54E7
MPAPSLQLWQPGTVTTSRLVLNAGSLCDSISRVVQKLTSLLVMPKPCSVFPLLLLLLPGVATHCHTATAEECKKHTAFVPGHNLAGEGIDVTTLERKGAYLVDTSPWRRKDGTCTLCQNSLLDRKPQRLPLAAVDWRVKVSCRRKLSSAVKESALGVVRAASARVKNDWKMGLEVKMKPSTHAQVELAGSHSKLAEFSTDKSQQDKYSFTSHEVSCKYYQFRVTQNPPLTSEFTQALMNLPEDYTHGSRLEYHQLIDTYGTHYLSQLRLGGRVRDVTAVRVCEAALDGVTADEIKDCLSVEASVSIGGGKGKAQAAFKQCEEQQKKKNFKHSFHETYSERHTEVTGGQNHADLLFSEGQDAEAFSSWMESLKESPDLVSYSLHPIHMLLDQDDPKREALGQAVSEYITERALWRNCTQSCPPGTQRSAHDPCSCVCPEDSSTNTMCCSKQRGQGKLTVTVERATHLWGDITSRTDAYVKVFFQDREVRTETVWNTDSPVWGVHLNLGPVRVVETSQLRIQVWDEDHKYDDDLLGSCDEPLRSGEDQRRVCYLNHGRLDFRYSLVCGLSLRGPHCWDYASQGQGGNRGGQLPSQ